MIPIIRTPNGLTAVLRGKTYSIAAGTPNYEDIVDAIRSGKDETAVLEIIERDKRRLEQAIQVTDSISIVSGVVMYKGQPARDYAAQRMLKMLDEGFDLKPMGLFLENLYQNPSYRAANSLYEFLEYGQMAITPDGCFIAYKAVRLDFKDIHSGTFDNSVGAVCEMPRNQVNEDPEVTCSNGLHVCSFEYLPCFAHADGHVVMCKVNPRDVVAIPRDYNNTKMRVCRYEVIGVYENYYVEHPECRLSQVSVYDGVNHSFEVSCVFDNGDTESESFELLSEAAAQFEAHVSSPEEGLDEVLLVNKHTGIVLDRKSIGYSSQEESLFDQQEELDDEETNCFAIRVYRTEDDFVKRKFESDERTFDDPADAKSEAIMVEEPYYRVVVENLETGKCLLTLVP